MSNEPAKEDKNSNKVNSSPTLPQATDAVKVRNKDDFQPLVDIKEPSLINLLKFSQIDEKRRQSEWQANYGQTNAAANLTEPKALGRGIEHLPENSPKASTFPFSAISKAAQTNMKTSFNKLEDKLAHDFSKAPQAISKNPANSKLQTSPRTKVRRRQSKKARIAYSFLAFSVVLLLAVIGVVIWQQKHKPVEMNFQLRLKKYEKSIIASARETGVWPSVTAAQLYIEAGDGPNKLADLDNNGFGLKWHDNMARRHRNLAWPVTYETKEYIDGEYVTIDDLFGKFANFEIGLFEHDRIWWNGYHEEARQALMNLETGTRDEFISAILHYATDPSYRAAITKVIQEQKLDYLDELAFPNGKRLQAGFLDLQTRAEKEAIQEAVDKLKEEKAKELEQAKKEQPKNDKPKAPETEANKELTEADLTSEQKQAALDSVKEKMFRSLGSYPDDGYNVRDLKNENLQTALKR